MTDQFVNMSFQNKGLKGHVLLSKKNYFQHSADYAQSKCIKHPFPLISKTKREEGHLITA